MQVNNSTSPSFGQMYISKSARTELRRYTSLDVAQRLGEAFNTVKNTKFYHLGIFKEGTGLFCRIFNKIGQEKPFFGLCEAALPKDLKERNVLNEGSKILANLGSDNIEIVRPSHAKTINEFDSPLRIYQVNSNDIPMSSVENASSLAILCKALDDNAKVVYQKECKLKEEKARQEAAKQNIYDKLFIDIDNMSKEETL